MGNTRESIVEETSADESPAFAEVPYGNPASPAYPAEGSVSPGVGPLRTAGILSAFAVTLALPALSVIVLLAVKPVFPLSPQPVGAVIFVLAFAYITACLFALAEMTSRPLTPRMRTRQPKASVFAAGVLLSLAAPAVVAVTAPHVAQTLLGKGLVCLQAALCAGAFAACLVTSVRLYRSSVARPRACGSHGDASMGPDFEGEARTDEHDRRERTKPWPATAALRIRNGFDRATFRSLAGVALVSCATGFGIILMLSPNVVGANVSYGIGCALLAVSVLLGAAALRSAQWTKIALGQWTGLLIGLNAGYFLAFHTMPPSGFSLPFIALPCAALALGLLLLLAHASCPAEEPSYTQYPPPEPTATNEQFCSKAAGAFRLTPREEETLLLVLENLEAHEIADELGVAPKTAKAYIRTLCRKIGAADVDGMVDELDSWWRTADEAV